MVPGLAVSLAAGAADVVVTAVVLGLDVAAGAADAFVTAVVPCSSCARWES